MDCEELSVSVCLDGNVVVVSPRVVTLEEDDVIDHLAGEQLEGGGASLRPGHGRRGTPTYNNNNP